MHTLFSTLHTRGVVFAALVCASAAGSLPLSDGRLSMSDAAPTCRSGTVHASPTSGVMAMRLRGGMADAAAQLAEIRAKKAAEYAAMKENRADSQARQKEEEAAYNGAQRAWTHSSGTLDAKSIGTKAEEMAIGDARAIYKGKQITYLRNKDTGMVVELMHESGGWLQFCALEGGALKQISKNGLLMDVNRWYAPGLLEQIKSNPLKSELIPTAGLTFGPWTCTPQGKQISISRSDDPTKALILTSEGFVFVEHGTGRGLSVDSFGATKYITTDEAERMLAAE